jgi:hypothetical protein
MQLRFASIVTKLGVGSILVFLNFFVMAQPSGLLYDPEPPVDSAYVRIVLASRDAAVDVMVDGRLRIQKLSAGDASEYMVLPAGKHSISIHGAGKPTPYFSTALDVVRGRAMCLFCLRTKPTRTS